MIKYKIIAIWQDFSEVKSFDYYKNIVEVKRGHEVYKGDMLKSFESKDSASDLENNIKFYNDMMLTGSKLLSFEVKRVD